MVFPGGKGFIIVYEYGFIIDNIGFIVLDHDAVYDSAHQGGSPAVQEGQLGVCIGRGLKDPCQLPPLQDLAHDRFNIKDERPDGFSTRYVRKIRNNAAEIIASGFRVRFKAAVKHASPRERRYDSYTGFRHVLRGQFLLVVVYE